MRGEIRGALAFMMHPVEDLNTALRMYCDDLGFREILRPDDATVLLAEAHSGQPTIMLEDDPFERRLGPGGVFLVPSLESWWRQKPGRLTPLLDPTDIPVGQYGVVSRPGGYALRLFDLTNATDAVRRLFESGGTVDGPK